MQNSWIVAGYFLFTYWFYGDILQESQDKVKDDFAEWSYTWVDIKEEDFSLSIQVQPVETRVLM